jgi:hypothetical protein
MRKLTRLVRFRLAVLTLVLALPAAVTAQYTYTTNNGTITITGYTGPAGAVTIPGTIDGLPVTGIGDEAFAFLWNLTNVTMGNSVSSIGDYAFAVCNDLTTITIPDGITSIGEEAFLGCDGLRGVYFQGVAPNVSGESVFDALRGTTTVYYLPGTTGWGTTFAGLPTALWKPEVQAGHSSFGVRTNQFGFDIARASGMTVVVEASTGLVNPTWSPISTNTFSGNTLYFSDAQWTNYPSRFYRVRWP